MRCLDGRHLPDGLIAEALGKVPSSDEIAAVRAAVRDAMMGCLAEADALRRLGPAEAFVAAVSAFPDLKQRLLAIQFVSTFAEASAALRVGYSCPPRLVQNPALHAQQLPGRILCNASCVL